MDYTPVTPFRRMVDAALLQHQARSRQQDLPESGVNKWELLRELAAARTAYNLSDRDLAVLQALVSFHPGALLDPRQGNLIVHPSNASICERLNGMACSTMRRHLSHLVCAGIVLRRDSPNGKRYARRYGDQKIAFGFDLLPLVQRQAEFHRAATAAREAQQRHKRLRETVSLMRRDLAGLAAYGMGQTSDPGLLAEHAEMAAQASRLLRRKLGIEELATLRDRLQRALDAARDMLETAETAETENMSTNECRNERHHQNSETESFDNEFRSGKPQPISETPISDLPNQRSPSVPEITNSRLPNVPLGLVLASCAEIHSYTERPLRHWHDLVVAADLVCPMMGISSSAWEEAKRCMGAEEAAVVVSIILDRFADIRSPGGYLRALAAKAASGAFSCGPMVMALTRRDAA